MRRAERPRSDVEEAELVAALQAGDNAAFETLVRIYSGKLLAVARRFLANEEDARDVVQEAFISTFKSVDRFRQGAKLSTWLHRIVVNAALMKIRSRQRRPEEPMGDLLPTFLEDGHRANPGSAWKEPAEAVERQETRRLVRQCIDRLPDAYRTVLLLRDIEELDTKETAYMLGTNENTVKIRLHRARHALRELLNPHFIEASP